MRHYKVIDTEKGYVMFTTASSIQIARENGAFYWMRPVSAIAAIIWE